MQKSLLVQLNLGSVEKQLFHYKPGKDALLIRQLCTAGLHCSTIHGKKRRFNHTEQFYSFWLKILQTSQILKYPEHVQLTQK